MNACSCLTLILACIVYWQAREISRLAAAPDFPCDPDLLQHVSPIEWKNVVLYGENVVGTLVPSSRSSGLCRPRLSIREACDTPCWGSRPTPLAVKQ